MECNTLGMHIVSSNYDLPSGSRILDSAFKTSSNPEKLFSVGAVFHHGFVPTVQAVVHLARQLPERHFTNVLE